MDSPANKIPPNPEQDLKGKKPRKNQSLILKLRPFIFLVVIVYILFSFGGLKLKLHQVNAEINSLEEEKLLLIQEQERLIQEKDKMNDPLYIERRAREALGLIKPGEIIILPAETGEAIPLKTEGMEDIRD